MTDNRQTRFQIFRTADAPSLDESSHMDVVGMTPEIGAFAQQSLQAGLDRAYDTRVIFSCPTMSLTYAWFKSDYPLPRHSHDSDCLYYIMAGSIQFGNQILGKGDGFFLPAEMPYAYTVGPSGVELLEFRGTDHFEFKWLTSGSAFWEAAIKTAQAKREAWLTEQPPLGAGGHGSHAVGI